MKRRPLHVFLVVGEPSGDQLGAKLMGALRQACDGVRFSGVAGPAMTDAGLESLFPLDDIAVMGFAGVAARFPLLYKRAWQTIRAILAEPPDLVVIIDSPDFTHAVAKRVRQRRHDIPIIDYVSPSVWAWRPGRARRMRGYVDHVLALLPFEPEALRRLGGPPCSYVGHPLIERLDALRPGQQERLARAADPPLVLALPGSRTSEVARLAALFGETFARLESAVGPLRIMLPTLPRHEARVRAALRFWSRPPEILLGEAEKLAAFRSARAALAASGTVTLELALAGVPMVGCYRVSGLEAMLARRLVQVPSVLLPNLILGEKAVPELLQEEARAETLSAALAPLVAGGPERTAQLDAFARLDRLMALDGGEEPSGRAARICLQVLAERRAAPPR